MTPLDVLVPSAGRPAALAVTLGGLLAQRLPLRVVVADQTPAGPGYEAPEAAAVVRVLGDAGHEVELHWRPQRRGIAEQRAFLLGRVRSDAALLLDDDVLLEPDALPLLVDALDVLGGGFVGMAPKGLTYVGDVRPREAAAFEPWEGPVRPERVRKGTPAWERWRLHNAANVVHLAERLRVPERGWVAYKVAWIAGCVLLDTAAARAVGGFDFWPRLPSAQRGEDVVLQLRLLERYGGAALLPSRAVHLELPTTMRDRSADAYALVLETDDAAEVERALNRPLLRASRAVPS